MEHYNIVHTDIWSMALPSDWTQQPAQDSGSVYFESVDGTKGMYINTWQLAAHDQRTAAQVAGAFKSNDLKTLFAMQGYAWQVAAESSDGDERLWTAVTDCHAKDKAYRAISKIIAAPPIVVRASFHDYGCVDYEASRRFFTVLVDSLRLARGEES